MVGDGLLLMVLGMGVVFIFLSLLAFLTSLFGDLQKLLPAPAAPAPQKGTTSRSAPAGAGDIVAVISAAVTAHRNSRQ